MRMEPKLTAVAHISAAQFQSMEEENDVSHMVLLCSLSTLAMSTDQTKDLTGITALLDQFHLVFVDPKALSKQKGWNHTIPLLEGTKRMNIGRFYNMLPLTPAFYM